MASHSRSTAVASNHSRANAASPRAASSLKKAHTTYTRSPLSGSDHSTDAYSRSVEPSHLNTALGARPRSVDWATEPNSPAISSTPRSSLNLGRSGSGRARLHKSNTSSQSQFTTPFATYEDPHFDMSSATRSKPRLRKASTAKEDQGCLDLSKSILDSGHWAGLGIQEMSGGKSVADISFSHTIRTKHDRSVSIGSQASSASGSSRPGQPFTHPMKQSPRSHTPPGNASYRSSWNVESIDETGDSREEEMHFAGIGRSRRSTSVSSATPNYPTPLSQSHTPNDLGIVPKLTSASQSNLSFTSNTSGSGKPLKLKKIRPSANGGRSVDNGTSPSSRTSFDKALSFVSRRSETEMPSQDELVRAARRKFEEKEAKKDRKYERDAARQRQAEEAKLVRQGERQWQKASAAERRPSMPALSHSVESATSTVSIDKKSLKKSRSGSESLQTKSYESYRSTHDAILPSFVEKATKVSERETARPQAKSAKSIGFSWWFHTRVLGCGAVR